MNKLPISVLIPTMNRPKSLKRTLKSYLLGIYIPSQIIIVDQSENSNDRLEIQNMISEYSNITEMIYAYQCTPSSTKARNTALKYAKEEIIVYSDDDVDVYEDTIKNIYNLMQDKSLAMIAGIDDNSDKSSSNIGYLLGTKSFINRKKGHVTLSMLGRFPNKIAEYTDTMWAMGFFFVVRQSLIKKWGIEWDENLTGYAYAEDLDFSYGYCKKAKENHMRTIMSKSVHVCHLASQEFRTPSKKSTYMYVLNRAYLSKKHEMGLRGSLAMKWCNFWRFVEKIVKKQGWKDMLDAMLYLERNKNEIYKGNFRY